MLEPIRVIVQDFPKFLSEYFNLKVLSLKNTIHARLEIYLDKASSKWSSFKYVLSATFVFKIKMSIKNASRMSSTTYIRQKGKFSTKLGTRMQGIAKHIRLVQKTSGKIKIPTIRAYLDPNAYAIGITAKLGYWDDKKLSEMDDMTMQNIALLRSED